MNNAPGGRAIPARKGWRQVKGGGASVEQVEHNRQTKQYLAMQRISQQSEVEADIVDTSRNHRGVGFRLYFGLAMAAFIVVMMHIKLQGEYIEPPARDDAEKADIEKHGDDAANQFYEMIDKERDAAGEQETKQDRAIRRKAEIKAAQEARDQAMKDINSPECDAECRAKALQIDVLNNAVSSQVVTDYYEVLEVQTGKIIDKAELRKNFEDVKKKVAEGDPSVQHLDLAEVEESYGTLMNNEARMYYNMYGTRPPAIMKANAANARDGGWGIQFQTHAWKVKKLKAWLEYFDSAELDIAVLLAIGGFSVLQLALSFRSMIQSMKQAFPDFDPEYAAQHEARMAQLRQQTLSRRGGARK
eukprot:TRINITY_DN20565_c0_g1_i1.p1 TRINITY_DN20565_c0_g1~~TRINITY_DN20565_c0_g1_i1.p1  ORF type:complete len:359 (+),score=173.73 TRINITY_DN20565_c0_g1_i1:79-1155(+)